MRCPECGSAELVPGVKELPFTYRGETLMLETHADFCSVCGGGILSDGLDGLSATFRREVDGGLVRPDPHFFREEDARL